MAIDKGVIQNPYKARVVGSQGEFDHLLDIGKETDETDQEVLDRLLNKKKSTSVEDEEVKIAEKDAIEAKKAATKAAVEQVQKEQEGVKAYKKEQQKKQEKIQAQAQNLQAPQAPPTVWRKRKPSPLKAYIPGSGVKWDLANPAYLASNTFNLGQQAGDAFAQAFTSAQEATKSRLAEYEAEWKQEAKDHEQVFGKLEVEKQFKPDIQANADVMAREWKAEYTELEKQRKKGKLNPADYAQKKNGILQRAQTFNKAVENVNAKVGEWQAALAEDGPGVSDSTPVEIRDIFDTLARGGGGHQVINPTTGEPEIDPETGEPQMAQGLTVQNVIGESGNPEPTLVGTTKGGRPVKVPISELASGDAVWDFNQKDTTVNSKIDEIAQILNGKISESPNSFHGLDRSGVVGKLAPWAEELAFAAIQPQDESLMRIIMADHHGVGDKEFNQLKEMPGGLEDIHKKLTQDLLDKVTMKITPPKFDDKYQEQIDQDYQKALGRSNINTAAYEEKLKLNQEYGVGNSGGGGTVAALKAQQQKEAQGAALQRLSQARALNDPNQFVGTPLPDGTTFAGIQTSKKGKKYLLFNRPGASKPEPVEIPEGLDAFTALENRLGAPQQFTQDDFNNYLEMARTGPTTTQ